MSLTRHRPVVKPGDWLTIYQCSSCGYIEGEEPGACCRKCGTKVEPESIDVEVQ